jgi:hypothetical protein
VEASAARALARARAGCINKKRPPEGGLSRTRRDCRGRLAGDQKLILEPTMTVEKSEMPSWFLFRGALTPKKPSALAEKFL